MITTLSAVHLHPKHINTICGSSSPDVRTWTLSYFKECIKAAAVLGADKMLIYLPAVTRDGDRKGLKRYLLKMCRVWRNMQMITKFHLW